MGFIKRFITGTIVGATIGIAAVILFAPEKREEWFDDIQEKTQDVLIEFNRAAEEYKEEMKHDLKARRNAE